MQPRGETGQSLPELLEAGQRIMAVIDHRLSLGGTRSPLCRPPTGATALGTCGTVRLESGDPLRRLWRCGRFSAGYFVLKFAQTCSHKSE